MNIVVRAGQLFRDSAVARFVEGGRSAAPPRAGARLEGHNRSRIRTTDFSGVERLPPFEDRGRSRAWYVPSLRLGTRDPRDPADALRAARGQEQRPAPRSRPVGSATRVDPRASAARLLPRRAPRGR